MSSLLAAVVALLGLMFAGTNLLEQDSLRSHIVGVLLLIVAALVLPGWTLWFYRRLIHRSGVASV